MMDESTDKVINSFCHTCKNRGPYVHACLDCVYFGCHTHIREHNKEEIHNFSLELTYGQLHCTSCGDYVYDSALDKISSKNRMKCGTFKKRLFECISWSPSEEEKEMLSHRSKKMCITPESTIGLRGLINLGATCFMNSIVQALMHTPLLRDYFISKQHSCGAPSGSCLTCEISKLFQEFYNGNRIPLALNSLLHLIWTHATHLSGFKQQDAHEFLIATLNLLHQHCSATMAQPSHGHMNGKCSCIVHQIFTGSLQSDVVCQNCHGVSTTIDPSWDFSLDLGPETEGGRSPCSLVDCLERFTKAEYLGSNAKIMCETCESKQESTKQFKIKTLPIVISFHLKRFEHFKKAETKISTAISFPEMLDMSPFMSKRKKDTFFPSDYRYSLFAVINHTGNSLNQGHYTAFVRQQHNFWYECNDEVITRANLDEVLNSEGYILFYHKQILEYE
ncbi:ubiquitin carboxyl-terminal hydrolase nonstop isoform X2 [Rhynchophorus ferrugineus]|uniref:ubiquitin carboxyl-terminal hydrolase nonstop isoform X2 n=1 Tax=Rhynchophorus ferrugineus TaxID=354439 RepID=UPI003FCD35D3